MTERTGASGAGGQSRIKKPRHGAAASKAAAVFEGTTARAHTEFAVDELRSLIDIGADWLWETDSEHRFSWLSESFERAAGVNPFAVLGRSRFDNLKTVARSSRNATQHLEDLQAHRPFRDFVYAPVQAAETCRWVSISGIPRFDEAGEFVGYRGLARNVTGVLAAVDELDAARGEIRRKEERERALENVAQVSESHAERLMAALNVMEDAFCYYDADDRVVSFNETMLSMYEPLRDVIRPGISFVELLDAGIERGMWPIEGDKNAWREKAIAVRHSSGGTPSIFMFSDGRWIMRRDMRTADGGTIAISTDISQMKRHEAKVEKARAAAEGVQQRLQAAIDAINDGFVLWDKEDRLVVCNDAFRQQFAFLKGLDEGRTYRELFVDFARTGVVPEAVGREEEWVDEHVQSRAQELDKEIVFQTHDGHWRMRRDSLTATGDRVGIRTDVTEIKKREAELAHAHEQSEQLRFDLARTLDSLGMGVILLNSDMEAEILNQAFYDIWRLTPEEIPVGSTFRALIEVNRHRGIYSVADDYWDDYVASRVAEVKAGDIAPREFLRADGCTMIYSVTALSGGKRLVSYFDITEMKKREADLATALERSKLADAVINGVRDPIFVKDGELRFVFVNKAFASLFGVEPATMIGKKGGDFLDPDKAAGFEESEREVLASGKPYEIEENFEFHGIGASRIVRKDRVATAAGKDYVSCFVFDITDVKRREIEAEEARQRLADVLESLPAGVIIYDRDDRFVLANRKVQDALPGMVVAMQPGLPLRAAMEAAHDNGYFRDSGDAALDALYDRDREAWIEGYMQRYHVRHSVFERSNPDGRWYQVFDTRTADGTFVGVRVDITELKERECVLNRSLDQIELFRHVLDELPVSAYVKSQDLSLEFVNKMWCAITGLEKEAVFGRRDSELFGAEGEGFTARDRKVVETGEADETEEALTHRDGSVRHLISKKSRLVGRDGAVHLIGSSADVTELKQREIELREAQQRAVLADRAKSEFLANMSHEIRTPMNGVLGMAELLSKSELDPKQKIFTDIIVKSGNALLTIINDILDFSKIDAGQLVLDPAPFNLTEAIEDVATLVSTRAKEKDLELIVRVAPGLPDTYTGDAGRIRQIITNLLGNAVKFTDAGHVLVDVSGESHDGETRLRVAVTDTGIGIPQEKLGLVFEKFSQADASSTRRHEGTGLGLAITSRLVALMGGEIGVESIEGKGSTFWFTVTLPSAAPRHSKKTTPVDVTGARLLIIDDNAVNRAILTEQMTSWGFDSCAAESGPEGLKVLETAARYGIGVDCVILDYQMPDMTGAEVADAIRSTGAIADTPIVMLTSVDQSLSGARQRDLGVDAHLIKPTRSSALLETLVSTIQRRRNRSTWGEAVPATNEPAPAPVSPAVSAPQPVASTGAGTQKTFSPAPERTGGIDILVAEDNEVNQLVFQQILADTPYSFEIAANGRLAVEAFRKLSPRMILMDVSMPEMNGMEATGAIREIEAPAGVRIPIVGVTAHALKGDRERCIEAGMDDYLSKPISPNALTQKVERWIGGEEASAKAG